MPNTATLKSPKPQIPNPAAAVAPTYSATCAFAMRSDRGLVRHVNQDACAALPEYGAFVVCDGVGGAAGGEVASHFASKTFLNSLKQSTSAATAPSTPALNGDHVDTREARLRHSVAAANQAVFERSQKLRVLRGMATTLVGALWDSDTLWIANVGDSRAYRFREGALELLTQDHSLVEEQLRAGLITTAQAEASPIRNVITRAIGSEPDVQADIAAHTVQPGDLFLLTSDGLTRELADLEITRILTRTASPNLEAACQALIDAANAHGGRDNITVLLITCP
jgi:serine/threonine protein phosphatase PrpC